MTIQGLPARPFSLSRGSTPGGRLLGSLLATALLLAAAALVARLAGHLATAALAPADLADLALAVLATGLSFASWRLLARGFGPSPLLLTAPLLLVAIAAGAAAPAFAGGAPGWVLVVAALALIGAAAFVVQRLRARPAAGELVGTTSPTGIRAASPGTGHLVAAVVVSVLGVLLGASAALTWLGQLS